MDKHSISKSENYDYPYYNEEDNILSYIDPKVNLETNKTNLTNVNE